MICSSYIFKVSVCHSLRVFWEVDDLGERDDPDDERLEPPQRPSLLAPVPTYLCGSDAQHGMNRDADDAKVPEKLLLRGRQHPDAGPISREGSVEVGKDCEDEHDRDVRGEEWLGDLEAAPNADQISCLVRFWFGLPDDSCAVQRRQIARERSICPMMPST